MSPSSQQFVKSKKAQSSRMTVHARRISDAIAAVESSTHSSEFLLDDLNQSQSEPPSLPLSSKYSQPTAAALETEAGTEGDPPPDGSNNVTAKTSNSTTLVKGAVATQSRTNRGAPSEFTFAGDGAEDGGNSGESVFERNGGDNSTEDHSESGPSSVADSSSADLGTTAIKKDGEIAARENTQVFYAKMMVFSVLLLATAAVAFLTYWYISGEEEEDFQIQFKSDAKELIDISNSNGRNILAVLGLLSTLFSSNARQAGATWPLYTLPDFEKFGERSRALSGALLLAFTPRVYDSSRVEWEDYSVNNTWWIDEGLTDLGLQDSPPRRNISDFIYRKTARSFVRELEFEIYSPVWQLSPAPTDTSVINFNLFNHPTFQRLVEFADLTRVAAISEVLDTSLIFGTSAPQKRDNGDPQSIAVLPVFQIPQDPTSPIIGHIVAIIPWGEFFANILQDGHNGVYVVLKESCGHVFTYSINGANATFLGTGDRHEPDYDADGQSTEFVAYDGDLSELDRQEGDDSPHCQYTISVYPSSTYVEDHETSNPAVFTIVVVMVFAFTSIIFVVYDCYVTKRQRKVHQIAVKSSAIVTSLFPAQVREKLYQNEDDKQQRNVFHRNKGNVSSAAAAAGMTARDGSGNHLLASYDHTLQSMNGGGDGGIIGEDEIGLVDNSPPIADLFPSATVLFMDIAGFTAWSSQREPSQVFILLETIYRSFDKIAKQRRVFKVETIGDCYVAVCGLPEPCVEHAVVMARFARDCLEKMNELARKLETSLGPDTADLAMRAGLHSGPVTAGVLRGERARFQLFGDTVNTAARMESTGVKKKIQVSQETAELIIAADKANWIKKRQDIVHAKGKGELQTFWLLPKRGIHAQGTVAPSEAASETETDLQGMDLYKQATTDEDSSVSSSNEETVALESARVQRLIDYTSDILVHILKKIVAKRSGNLARSADQDRRIQSLESTMGQAGICLEEVAEVVELPGFDSAAYSAKEATVSEEVVSQLCSYVDMIAGMYRANPFHNFDHASHVTQSVSKLLSRIVAVNHIQEAEQLHDHTYGITSDPLTQFAMVFSSLIHDVDHRGVPNFLLVKEDPAMGALYQNQAVAEQNSVDVAWNLLMDPSFAALRQAIYSNEAELKRFRQLVVNSLMATDIFDKQLAGLRKQRWENAFFEEHPDEDPQVSTNRKATIVIEHIIQASDVSHTMQHWHVYSKWNTKLFQEMFDAYCHGRSDEDPTFGWYKGELWFFDNYVIPLAHKLKECGVFGVSSDEYLQYALANRREWEAKGESIVKENFAKYQKELQNRKTDSRRSITHEMAPLPTHE